MNQHMFGPLITVAIVILVLVLRMRRMGRSMRLRLETLWITPAIFIAMATFVVVQIPLQSDQWLWLAVAPALGGVVGWYRGAMMRITVDPETHTLNQQASPAAFFFLIALVVIRFGFRTLFASEAQAWHLDAIFLTDIFLFFAVGIITLQRVEMALRARRLLQQARAARARGA